MGLSDPEPRLTDEKTNSHTLTASKRRELEKEKAEQMEKDLEWERSGRWDSGRDAGREAEERTRRDAGREIGMSMAFSSWGQSLTYRKPTRHQLPAYQFEPLLQA